MSETYSDLLGPAMDLIRPRFGLAPRSGGFRWSHSGQWFDHAVLKSAVVSWPLFVGVDSSEPRAMEPSEE